MLAALGAAETADPEYDQAGPARVKALVLVKAPAWPLGPGDSEAGLESARRAVALRPEYPPNVLALAEALAKTGDAHGAQDAYRHAQELSRALPPSRDREDWLRQADQALGRSR
jgi:cytochrome c-type biogenesis protein CcmH/NrfG